MTPDRSPSSLPSGAPTPDLPRSMLLVRQFEAGDREALNELFQRYEDRVERIVRSKLGRRLRELVTVEDVTQEVFLVAMKRIGDFDLRSHAGILKWLEAIAEHQVCAQARYYFAAKRDRDRETPLEPGAGAGATPTEPAGDGPSPLTLADRADLEELVDACVRDLAPMHYREVILQRDYYQEDWELVRRLLSCSTVEAARELHRRAHLRLRSAFKRELDRRRTDGLVDLLRRVLPEPDEAE